MLYVKIMSGEDRDDTHPIKNFTIVPVADSAVIRFCENSEGEGPDIPRFMLEIRSADGEHEGFPLTGNAYVMTETGKTIASHGF